MRCLRLPRGLGPLTPLGLGRACLPWAGLLLAIAPVSAGPLPAGSLLPLEAEAFRARYGQEALFRLRLGVDATLDPAAGSPGEVPGAQPGRSGPCPPSGWAASPERRQFDQAVEQQRYYAAGQVLGLWQRRHGACP